MEKLGIQRPYVLGSVLMSYSLWNCYSWLFIDFNSSCLLPTLPWFEEAIAMLGFCPVGKKEEKKQAIIIQLSSTEGVVTTSPFVTDFYGL